MGPTVSDPDGSTKSRVRESKIKHQISDTSVGGSQPDQPASASTGVNLAARIEG